MNERLVYFPMERLCEAAPIHIDLNKVMYTNTYPLFLKLMNFRNKGESLSEAIYEAFIVAKLPVNNFWNASSNVFNAYVNLRKSICYSFLNERIKEIYLNGQRYLLKEYDGVRHIEVFYCGFLYSFLTDFHEDKEVVVLTDFYKPEDRKNENLLLSSINGKSFIDDNEPVHYMRTQYNTIIINTYNAFCNFANYLNRPQEKSLNKELFQDFMINHSVMFGIPMGNEKMFGDSFNYIEFDNVVILFDFIVEFSEKDKMLLEEMLAEEDDDMWADGEAAMQELIDSYAFADEGIFPSGDYRDWF